ncbi:hypothetical protein GCM10020256_64910 [Streptomyces thermocoprophilus]
MASMAADARRAAVLGKPIAHSLSPVLHRAAYAELGLDGWTYDRFEVDEAQLAPFVEGLGPEWAGLSLTMPLKRAVLPLLDEITETARSVEAVNTLVFTDDGRRVGDNTDIPGMVAALREHGIEQVETAAVLGAGATASSALAALSRVCAGEITVHVRSEARAAEMRAWGERLDVDVRIADWADAAEALHAPSSSRRPRPGRPTPSPTPYPSAPPPCSTCCTTPGPPRSPPAGPCSAAPSSAASTCWCTRRSSRSSR